MKYRVKVESTNGGKISYIPQVGIPKLNLGRVVHLWLDWFNIIDNREDVSSSKYVSICYGKQEDAIKMIDRYKKKINKEKINEVQTVTYINID
jgi:hypothetical protein